MVVRLDLMILKNLQFSFYQLIKTLFCSVAIVGLTDFSRFFLVTPRGSRLHQIIPPPSSLIRNPVYSPPPLTNYIWSNELRKLFGCKVEPSVHEIIFRIRKWSTIGMVHHFQKAVTFTEYRSFHYSN